MDGSVVYGVVSLMGAQVLAVVLGAIIYSRQKSALDIEKRDRGTFGAKVDKALQQAHDALLGVERIDVEQYRALAKKLADAYQEIEMLKARVLAQDESIKSLSNKLASRERADRRAAVTHPAPDDDEVEPGQSTAKKSPQAQTLEALAAQGIAVPLFPEQNHAPQNHRPPGFGKVIGR